MHGVRWHRRQVVAQEASGLLGTLALAVDRFAADRQDASVCAVHPGAVAALAESEPGDGDPEQDLGRLAPEFGGRSGRAGQEVVRLVEARQRGRFVAEPKLLFGQFDEEPESRDGGSVGGRLELLTRGPGRSLAEPGVSVQVLRADRLQCLEHPLVTRFDGGGPVRGLLGVGKARGQECDGQQPRTAAVWFLAASGSSHDRAQLYWRAPLLLLCAGLDARRAQVGEGSVEVAVRGRQPASRLDCFDRLVAKALPGLNLRQGEPGRAEVGPRLQRRGVGRAGVVQPAEFGVDQAGQKRRFEQFRRQPPRTVELRERSGRLVSQREKAPQFQAQRAFFAGFGRCGRQRAFQHATGFVEPLLLAKDAAERARRGAVAGRFRQTVAQQAGALVRSAHGGENDGLVVVDLGEVGIDVQRRLELRERLPGPAGSRQGKAELDSGLLVAGSELDGSFQVSEGLIEAAASGEQAAEFQLRPGVGRVESGQGL